MEERYFPVFMNLNRKKVLLVGAGNIAARRADGLLRFGVSLTVIAPEIGENMQVLAGQYGLGEQPRLQLQEREYHPEDCEGYDMVLSATNDPAADDQVYRQCKALGIPVNIASDQNKCDFYFPALVEQDDIVIGVCSGGRDHRKVRAISAKLREVLKQL